MNAERLRNSTFVRHVELHEELGSSNDRAIELARHHEFELPAIVIARRQTAGRGRGTNKWLSAEGALTFSVLIDPASLGISAARWPQLSLAMALAVCDALTVHVGRTLPTTVDEAANDETSVGNAHPANPQSARLGVKWPNDVMLDGAKVCGILIESPGGAAHVKNSLVIGIGININNSCRGALHHSGANRIALCDVSQRKHSLQDILEAVLRAISTRLEQVGRDDPELTKSWQDRCWLTGQRVEVQSGNSRVEGVCLGIDGNGALLIESAVGAHRLASGTVRVK